MLKLKCKKHPKYAGKMSPRASCYACIEIYNIRLRALMHGDVTVVDPPKVEVSHE